MVARLTVSELLAGRGSVQRTNVFVMTPDEAEAAERAGIDMITVDGRILTPEIRAAAPGTFFIGGLAFGHLATADEYLRAACDLYELGVDAFYCAAGAGTIERLSSERLPVVGHVGLIPWHVTWTGGYRAVGKTAEGALEVWRQVRRLEDAGAFGAEIEVVPPPVATAIAERTSLFLISMGPAAAVTRSTCSRRTSSARTRGTIRGTRSATPTWRRSTPASRACASPPSRRSRRRWRAAPSRAPATPSRSMRVSWRRSARRSRLLGRPRVAGSSGSSLSRRELRCVPRPKEARDVVVDRRRRPLPVRHGVLRAARRVRRSSRRARAVGTQQRIGTPSPVIREQLRAARGTRDSVPP